MNPNDDQLTDVFHVNRDEVYLRRAQEEAAYWDRPQLFTSDSHESVLDSYWNERFTGDGRMAWYETIPNYGTFARACAVGTGGREQNASILQQYPALHLTVYDISRGSLDVVDAEEGSKFPGRVTTVQADLNFAELPEDAYDLVVSSSCLHHLLNLEHIAYQINRSLTADGYFFIYDYVGESQMRFSEEKRRAFERILAEAQARHPALQDWQVVWPELPGAAHSPFEGIRAGDTLDVLGRYMEPQSLQTAGAIVGLCMYLQPIGEPDSARTEVVGAIWERARSFMVRRLRGRSSDRSDVIGSLLVPELIAQERDGVGSLLPMSAFGVYKKRA